MAITEPCPPAPNSIRRGIVLAVSVESDLYAGLADEANDAAITLPDYIRHVVRGRMPPLKAGTGHWLDLTLRCQLWMAARCIACEPRDHHHAGCPACTSAEKLKLALAPIDAPRTARSGLRPRRKPQIRTTVSVKRHALIGRRARQAGCSPTDYVRDILRRRQRPIRIDFQPAIDAHTARAWIDSLRFWLLAATEGVICSACRRVRSEQLSQIAHSAPPWPETRCLQEVLDA